MTKKSEGKTSHRYPLLSYDSIRNFLSLEARLLDQRHFDRWNSLFTEDGMYWMPLADEQPDPINHLSLIYEDAMMREVRINRLRHERAWSQKPRSRTAHVIGSIVIEKVSSDELSAVVGSAFQMSEWRSFGLRTFAGLCTHDLVVVDATIRISQKRVDLINSEDIFEPIEVFI